MRLLRADEVRPLPGETIFRPSRVMMGLLPVVLLGVAGGLAWAILNDHMPSFFWFSVALLLPMAALGIGVNWWPTFRSTSWVMRVRDGRALVMLRSFRNRHFPGDAPTVVEFEPGEIVAARQFSEVITSPSSHSRTTVWMEHSLELILADTLDTAPLVAALEAERSRVPPRTGFIYSKLFDPSPITLPRPGVVRIRWQGRFDVISPHRARALKLLAGWMQIEPAVRVRRDQPSEMSNDEFDALVLDRCEQGDTISAMKLLVEHREMTLAEAKTFIDQLTQYQST